MKSANQFHATKKRGEKLPSITKQDTAVTVTPPPTLKRQTSLASKKDIQNQGRIKRRGGGLTPSTGNRLKVRVYMT